MPRPLIIYHYCYSVVVAFSYFLVIGLVFINFMSVVIIIVVLYIYSYIDIYLNTLGAIFIKLYERDIQRKGPGQPDASDRLGERCGEAVGLVPHITFSSPQRCPIATHIGHDITIYH